MFGQFTWQMQPHSSLDFPAGDGVFPIVVSQVRSFGGNVLKDVVHKGVHDAHGLAGDTGVGVHLLQHLVDVDGVALLAQGGVLPNIQAVLLPKKTGTHKKGSSQSQEY